MIDERCVACGGLLVPIMRIGTKVWYQCADCGVGTVIEKKGVPVRAPSMDVLPMKFRGKVPEKEDR